MITNRRTSFTDIEYPNPFRDPGWTTDSNKTLVASVAAGQKKTYVIPDGASGWYAMYVTPDGVDSTGSKYYNSWGYAYLHEGSSVELWCNNGTTSVTNRKCLGADGVSALGGAAGILCGFKKLENISDANYGTYPTAAPIRVVNAQTAFTPWTITMPDGSIVTRYTLGTENWDATSFKNSAIFILIDGKPCLSFEDPKSVMAASGATKVKGTAKTFDGIYLGTVPVEMNKSIFTLAAGLICGQSSNTTANGGGGALGSSQSREGPTGDFGKASANGAGHGGSAFFDFTRGIAESNTRRGDFTTQGNTTGAWLFKLTEPGHDYSQPYAQRFTAPASTVDCVFRFYINGAEYTFPSVWPDANKQKANSGDYVTYIPGCHIGDTLTVVAAYSNGRTEPSVYKITMHSIVYGLELGTTDILLETAGTYNYTVAAGVYKIEGRGGGGAGGQSYSGHAPSDSVYGADGAGGAGGVGSFFSATVFLTDFLTNITARVGSGGLAGSAGNGGASGLPGYSDGNGATGGATDIRGGGGGHASYVKIGNKHYIGQGGGGGGAGGQRSYGSRYAAGSGGGGGGGYYHTWSDGTETNYPGQPGAGGIAPEWGNGSAGTNGNTTTPGFNAIYAGTGGKGYYNQGGAGGVGGGASGGSGSGSKRNDSSGWKRPAGSGGGGAGGSPDASCGGNGSGSIYGDGAAGYNFHTTPTASTNWKGERTTSGSGVGGYPGSNGTTGWVHIIVIGTQTAATETLDMGSITDSVDKVLDFGLVTESVETTRDFGTLYRYFNN